MTLMVEREVKLRFESPDEARAAILAAGAAPLRCRRLQEDALFDTEDEILRRRRCVLRVRTEAGKSLLTFKGPVQPGTMKIRDEYETVVADGDVLQHVLEELGMHVWFRYEKYREEYAAEDVTIALDETPVGTYVEIEGGQDRHRSHDTRAWTLRRRLHPRLLPWPVHPAPGETRRQRRSHGVPGGMIPALVLTAGLATRLRPLSLVRAKAAVPVAGQPLVRRILAQLRSAGVTDAVLNLHHLPHTITGVVGDGSDLDMRVRYSWERPILGSAGGPRLALPLLDGSTFLIANGDTLADVDIPSLVAAHRRSGALVTLAVTPSPDPKKYGGIVADADGSMTGFTTAGSTEASWHFVGLQVAESDAFASVEAGSPCESVRALYPALIAARPGSVRVHACAAEFFDIGTPDDYRHTSRLLAQREERCQRSTVCGRASIRRRAWTTRSCGTMWR